MIYYLQMDNLPEELILLICERLNSKTLNIMKLINNHISKFISVKYGYLFTNLINKSERFKTGIKLRNNNKVYKIINDTECNPSRLLIHNSSFNYYDLYDIDNFKFLTRSCISDKFGTYFYISINNVVYTFSSERLYKLFLSTYKNVTVVNDYIFELIKIFHRNIIIKNSFGDNVMKIEWHGKMPNIIYQNNKYVLINNTLIMILDKKFNILYKIGVCGKFIYAHDKFYIIEYDGVYRLIDYNNNLLLHKISGKYVKAFIISNCIYLITNHKTINVFNMDTYHIDATFSHDYYIYEFNTKYMIVGKNSNLYCIYL